MNPTIFILANNESYNLHSKVVTAQ